MAAQGCVIIPPVNSSQDEFTPLTDCANKVSSFHISLQFFDKAIALSLIAGAFMMPSCSRGIHEDSSRNTVDARKRVAANYVPDELLVQFKPGTDPSKIKALNESLGVDVIRTLAGGQVNLVKIPSDKSLEAIRRAYLASPEVESVGLNYKAVGQ